jgi:hypothetical protein
MPPSQEYLPDEKYAEMLPSFQYQLFFASPESTALIDANVCTHCFNFVGSKNLYFVTD